MRTAALSIIRHHLLRETTLTHIALLVGIGMLSAIFAVANLGETSSPPAAQPVPAAQAAPAEQTVSGPEVQQSTVPHQDSPVSARGDRPFSLPAESGPVVAAAAATTVPEPASTPEAAVPTPLPTTLPAAAPEAPPTVAPRSPVPTVAPVAQPTPAPAVNLSALSQLRVGLQAGHWKNSELPAELASLRGSTGAAGSGWREVDVNLAVAQKTAAILRDRGIVVDLIPATVPVAYKANAFVSIHGDANSNTTVSGYKLARASWSKIPQQEDALVKAVSAEYAAASGLKEHPNTITANMRQYYAFNWRSLQHAVASTTPSAILELGFLTTASDRKLMLEQQDRLAEGIAKGIIRFLTGE